MANGKRNQNKKVNPPVRGEETKLPGTVTPSIKTTDALNKIPEIKPTPFEPEHSLEEPPSRGWYFGCDDDTDPGAGYSCGSCCLCGQRTWHQCGGPPSYLPGDTCNMITCYSDWSPDDDCSEGTACHQCNNLQNGIWDQEGGHGACMSCPWGIVDSCDNFAGCKNDNTACNYDPDAVMHDDSLCIHIDDIDTPSGEPAINCEGDVYEPPECNFWDDCGICEGSTNFGSDEGDICDCTLDANGEPIHKIRGCDGVCDSGVTRDNCGTCGGSGPCSCGGGDEIDDKVQSCLCCGCEDTDDDGYCDTCYDINGDGVNECFDDCVGSMEFCGCNEPLPEGQCSCASVNGELPEFTDICGNCVIASKMVRDCADSASIPFETPCSCDGLKVCDGCGVCGGRNECFGDENWGQACSGTYNQCGAMDILDCGTPCIKRWGINTNAWSYQHAVDGTDNQDDQRQNICNAPYHPAYDEFGVGGESWSNAATGCAADIYGVIREPYFQGYVDSCIATMVVPLSTWDGHTAYGGTIATGWHGKNGVTFSISMAEDARGAYQPCYDSWDERWLPNCEPWYAMPMGNNANAPGGNQKCQTNEPQELELAQQCQYGYCNASFKQYNWTDGPGNAAWERIGCADPSFKNSPQYRPICMPNDDRGDGLTMDTTNCIQIHDPACCSATGAEPKYGQCHIQMQCIGPSGNCGQIANAAECVSTSGCSWDDIFANYPVSCSGGCGTTMQCFHGDNPWVNASDGHGSFYWHFSTPGYGAGNVYPGNCAPWWAWIGTRWETQGEEQLVSDQDIDSGRYRCDNGVCRNDVNGEWDNINQCLHQCTDGGNGRPYTHQWPLEYKAPSDIGTQTVYKKGGSSPMKKYENGGRVASRAQSRVNPQLSVNIEEFKLNPDLGERPPTTCDNDTFPGSGAVCSSCCTVNVLASYQCGMGTVGGYNCPHGNYNQVFGEGQSSSNCCVKFKCQSMWAIGQTGQAASDCAADGGLFTYGSDCDEVYGMDGNSSECPEGEWYNDDLDNAFGCKNNTACNYDTGVLIHDPSMCTYCSTTNPTECCQGIDANGDETVSPTNGTGVCNTEDDCGNCPGACWQNEDESWSENCEACGCNAIPDGTGDGGLYQSGDTCDCDGNTMDDTLTCGGKVFFGTSYLDICDFRMVDGTMEFAYIGCDNFCSFTNVKYYSSCGKTSEHCGLVFPDDYNCGSAEDANCCCHTWVDGDNDDIHNCVDGCTVIEGQSQACGCNTGIAEDCGGTMDENGNLYCNCAIAGCEVYNSCGPEDKYCGAPEPVECNPAYTTQPDGDCSCSGHKCDLCGICGGSSDCYNFCAGNPDGPVNLPEGAVDEDGNVYCEAFEVYGAAAQSGYCPQFPVCVHGWQVNKNNPSYMGYGDPDRDPDGRPDLLNAPYTPGFGECRIRFNANIHTTWHGTNYYSDNNWRRIIRPYNDFANRGQSNTFDCGDCPGGQNTCTATSGCYDPEDWTHDNGQVYSCADGTNQCRYQCNGIWSDFNLNLHYIGCSDNAYFGEHHYRPICRWKGGAGISSDMHDTECFHIHDQGCCESGIVANSDARSAGAQCYFERACTKPEYWDSTAPAFNCSQLNKEKCNEVNQDYAQYSSVCIWEDVYACNEVGDMNLDGGYNVLDIVILANCILAANCPCQGDINRDGGENVLDIVALVNCVLAQNCGAQLNNDPEQDLLPETYAAPYPFDSDVGRQIHDNILQQIANMPASGDLNTVLGILNGYCSEGQELGTDLLCIDIHPPIPHNICHDFPTHPICKKRLDNIVTSGQNDEPIRRTPTTRTAPRIDREPRTGRTKNDEKQRLIDEIKRLQNNG